MNHFHINIAKDQTHPRAKRELYYRLMIAYIGVVGILLVLTAYQAARTFSDIHSRKSQLNALRKQFKAEHPGAESIATYVQELEQSLDYKTLQMKGTLQATAPRTPLRECLFRLYKQLPEDMHIQKMTIDPGKKGNSIVISFTMPTHKIREENDPSLWVQRWKEDVYLSDLVTGLTLIDRRDNVMRNQERVTEFTCTAQLRKAPREER